MLFRCPKCGRAAVAWNSRSKRFLCHQNSCNASYPMIVVRGTDAQAVARLLNLESVHPEDVLEWLQRCEVGDPKPLKTLTNQLQYA